MKGRAFTLIFILLLGLPGALNAGFVQLPQTGQQTCWNDGGLQISCSGAGQDGDLQKGEVWPAPRFTDQGQTITDNLTNLIWTKDAQTPGTAACKAGSARTWQEALDHVKCLNSNSYLGYNDWRLPNINELESLVNYERNYPDNSDQVLSVAGWLMSAGQGFTTVQGFPYWSSSSVAATPDYAWVINMYAGYLQSAKKVDVGGYVWPVRTALKPDMAMAVPSIPDGATGTATRPILDWGAVSGASVYDLYLWKDGEARPAAPAFAGLSAGSVKARTELAVSSLYHWQVVAKNISGQTEGPVWSFTTRASIFGDINGDGQVSLADAVLSLLVQIRKAVGNAGIRSDYAASGVDVGGNRKIGLEETIYILQEVAEIR